MKNIFDFLLVFLLGFFSCTIIFFGLYNSGSEVPFGFGNDAVSPSDWILEDDLIILKDKIIINIENSELSYYSPSGSMKPVLDKGSNGIRIVPKDSDRINVGDIVSFNKDGMLIVHRIIEKGYDDFGLYFITKGDNNDFSDGKIRFEDIKYVTVGILY